MKKVNVLQVFKKMDRGGAELRTIELMKNMKDKEIKFYFVILSGEKGELDEVILEHGGEIIYIKLKSILFPIRFINMLKKYQINVVHSNMYYFSGVILALSNIAKVPKRIAHFRTISNDKKKTPLNILKYYIFKKLILINSTKILGVSQSALESSLGKKHLKDDRVEVLYNAIDLSRMNEIKDSNKNTDKDIKNKYNLNENSNIFIHIGRMAKAKNHSKLIDIFIEYLNTIDPNSYLFLIGKKEEQVYNLIIKKLNKHNIVEKVFFLGEQENVFTFLKQADYMIYPSIREGLPGAVLEAIACEVQVVASDIAPHRELKSFFSEIKCIPLNSPNSAWIRELQCTQQKKRTEINFSSFTISNYIKKYKRIINE